MATVALLSEAAPAGAVFVKGRPARGGLRASTDLVMSGTGAGQGVAGYIASAANPFDPVADGYPTSNPPTTPGSGWSVLDESFAGIIHARPPDGGAELSMYCIDILTETRAGIGYVLGTWDAANVPNVGYVARLLNDYYPNTDAPTRLANLDQKAAAVQAAIWFFSDRWVMSTSDSLRGDVVAIVNHVISQGPLSAPSPPSLSIRPESRSGTVGRLLGPFTVTTDHPPATVSATGAAMFSNAAGTDPIADGATVPSGQEIWLRSSGPASAVLQATSVSKVPSGNVYLYDGFVPDLNNAQTLILAHGAELTTTVRATAEFQEPGAIRVQKTIAGPAAGSHGRVVIHVRCDDGAHRRPFVIAAGAAAGTRVRTYHDIPVGTICTVVESANGSNQATDVTVTGDGQTVTIEPGKTKTVHITDTYHFALGSLIVRKTIAGPAAGQQGEITIHTVCNGSALEPDFIIQAGAPEGSRVKQYDDIPTPANCTVTETAHGSSSTVSVVVEGSGQRVSVPPGEIEEADVSDTYGLAPGEFEVTKSIAGLLAGEQGQIVIRTVCNGTVLSPDFVIPAGATGDHSQIYSGVPTPASCTVTETGNGSTSTVSVAVIGSPDTTTIPPGGAGAAHITDSYGPAPGSLLITKTIGGPAAGHQGPVSIQVICDGAPVTPTFVIPAGEPGGAYSHAFDGIPAGSVCTVSETADGATNTVTVIVTGHSEKVTVPAGRVVLVAVTDMYERTAAEPDVVPEAPRGYLRVTKTIAGPAAGKQGRIAVLVACGGPVHTYAFVIPAHHRAGSVSRVFPGLPVGARCTVTETARGLTGTVTATSSGTRQTVTIRSGGGRTVRITDTFFGGKAVSVTG